MRDKTWKEETQRADTAEHELRNFSQIVSHDLTASLRHISEFSHLLMRDIGPDASATAIAHSDRIQEATEKCQHMIEALLTYSRVQQAVLAYERCNMKRLWDLAAFQLSTEVQGADAEVSIDEMGECFVDPGLVNLAARLALSNSIKFRRPGVRPHIAISSRRVADALFVLVVDNGIGVVIERQEKMFDMFYKDHADGAFTGVGAGLTICRKILRLHGGDARFVDAPQGTCLQISIPFEPDAVLPTHGPQ